MADRRQLEFFLLRYVPDAVKDEFVNIGVVMVEAGAGGDGFAEVRFTRDWLRVGGFGARYTRAVGAGPGSGGVAEEIAGFVFQCDSAFAGEGVFSGRSGG
jgi:hypothetical protein